MAGLFQRLPMRARAFDLGRVMAIEQEHGAFVAGEIRGGGTVDEEAYLRLVGIGLAGGQEDRLLGGLAGE